MAGCRVSSFAGRIAGPFKVERPRAPAHAGCRKGPFSEADVAGRYGHRPYRQVGGLANVFRRA